VALVSRADRPAVGIFETSANGELSGTASRFELFYMKQPGGGHLTVDIDGERVARLATDSERPETAYTGFEAPDGHHRVAVRTESDGVVRLFGMAVERDSPGVIVDTLGIPGARIRYHLEWDDAIYREHLARRKPDLVVLAYGTNEAGDDDVPITLYEARLRKALERIREVLPTASCLLIGPSDRPLKVGRTKYEPRPRTEQVIATQRRVAPEFTCGFFDLVGVMGGPMSMVQWVAADPPLGAPDHVHLTRLGYETVGEALYGALMASFPANAADEE
jgi:lysophospholipase L1-like esterase